MRSSFKRRVVGKRSVNPLAADRGKLALRAAIEALETRRLLSGQPNLSVTAADSDGGSSISNSIGTATPGTSITYTFAISNTGTGTAQNVVVSDTLPAQGLSNVTAATLPPGVTFNAATDTFNIGSLAAGATAVLALSGTIPVGATGTYTNSISASASNATPVSALTQDNLDATPVITSITGGFRQIGNTTAVPASGGTTLTVTGTGLYQSAVGSLVLTINNTTVPVTNYTTDPTGNGTRITFVMPSIAQQVGPAGAVAYLTYGDQGGTSNPEPLYTGSLVVTTTDDNDNPAGFLTGDNSLRDAIAYADAQGGGTINFASNLAGQTITLNGSDLELAATANPVTIDASSVGGVTISGNLSSNVFQVDSGATATLTGLTITGGMAQTASSPQDDARFGGGITNAGALTLMDDTISGNAAYSGGAISTTGALTIINTTISNNNATFGAGIFTDGSANVSITGSTLSGNTASFEGGAIDNNTTGTETLINTTITGNSSTHQGGGIAPDDSDIGTLVIDDSTIVGNIGTAGADVESGAATTTVTNSIISDFLAFNTLSTSNSLFGPFSAGTLGSLAFAKIPSAQNGNIIVNSVAALGLGTLGNYGGPTQTIPLLPGSPAIGAGTGSVSAVQQLTISGSGGGQISIEGQSFPLAGTVTAAGLGAQLDAALQNSTELSPTVAANASVKVSLVSSQGSTSVFNITFAGSLANSPQPLIGATGNGNTTISVSTITAGVSVPATDQTGYTRSLTAPSIGAYENEGFTITATSGTPQLTPTSTAFATALGVKVTSNNALLTDLAGGVITFTAPSTGASATFSTNPITLAADGTGSATATANSTGGGRYTVSATGSGVTNTATFLLTNVAEDNTISGTDYLVSNTTTAGGLTTSTTGVPIAGTKFTVTGTDLFGNGVSQTLTTNASGQFSFGDLNPSNASGYTITETPPSTDTHLGQISSTDGAVTTTGAVVSKVVLISGSSTDNFFETASVTVSGTDYLVPSTTTAASLTTSTTGTPIVGTSITLTGTDVLGNAVSKTTVTNASGQYNFPGLNPSNASGYTITETVPAGDSHTGQTSTTPGAVTTPASTPVVSNTVLTSDGTRSTDNFFDAVAPVAVGQLIGTPSANTTASYDGKTSDNYTAAFDGNTGTFFDSPTASGNYVQLDLGSAKTITEIAFAPRAGFESRMMGGIFEASNDPTFASGVMTLYTVTTVPSDTLSFENVSPGGKYEYVRYVAPGGSYGNIAEMQVFGPGGTSSVAELTGTTSANTTASYNNDGDTYANAFDGNTSTTFDSPYANGNYVQIDLGTTQSITQIVFAPRVGFEYRMTGGVFEASNDPNFAAGVTTLYTVSSAPADGLNTVNVSASDRYVRYVAPDGSYGNIAEMQVYGPGTTVPTPPAPPTPTPTPTQLTGTPSANTTASYNNNGETYANVFDGNTSTFFDSPSADGNYVQLDLGSAQTITQIAYAPRSGFESRMTGGIIEASNDPTFASGVATLYTVSAPPADGLTTQTVNPGGTYRYVRYVAPSGSYGNIAELQVFGPATTPVTPPPASQLTGTASANTTASYDGKTTDNFTAAFDGSTSTFFDAPTANGNYVQLDLGSAKTITSIEYAPRVGFEGRMVGGIFEASNDPTFATGVTVLDTIASTPADGLNTQLINVTGTFEFVRYIAPNGSYGNIAEMQLFGM